MYEDLMENKKQTPKSFALRSIITQKTPTGCVCRQIQDEVAEGGPGDGDGQEGKLRELRN